VACTPLTAFSAVVFGGSHFQGVIAARIGAGIVHAIGQPGYSVDIASRLRSLGPNGDRYRCVLDEHSQLRLSFCEVRFSALAFDDIDKHVDGTGQSPGFICSQDAFESRRDHTRPFRA
jgi:hypothetical protein